MDILFMGTPEFAVPSLEELASSGHNVRLVVTQPDRPRGRGQRMIPSPVKMAAERLGIIVAQPERLRAEEFLRRLTELAPDLIVVAAYGKLLPKELIDLPRCGCVNIHASLLPKYRGAAPVHRAIEAGETVTGVTLMRMSEGLDEGDMLDQREVAVGDSDTGELMARLAATGARMLREDLDALLAGELVGVPQDAALAAYAPMVSKEEAWIDFAAPRDIVLRKIRAMNPFPGAYVFLDGEKLKLLAASATDVSANEPPGTVLSAERSTLVVATGAGAIALDRVQLSGKKALSAEDFLRGHTVPEGTLLE